MKKGFVVLIAVLAIAVAGYFLALGTGSVEAMEKLNGIAYISGHGGHLAILNLATMKSPTDVEKDRIVITEAGSEMEGVIAGMNFEKAKKAGGSHGAALLPDEKLAVGLLDGDVVVYDLKTGKKTKPMKVGEKFCGANVGPDGNVYFEDMANGDVYAWDPKEMKPVDKIPVGKAVCGIAWTHDDKKAYVSDMVQGVVYILDWKTKKTIKVIKNVGTFIHQLKMTPDGKQVWVAAANEFDPGLKPPTHPSQLIVISTATDKIIKRITLPKERFAHDMAFSPDGKTVLVTARTYGNDSVVMVMDTKTDKIEKTVSVCYSCHGANGIKVSIDKGSPLLCGIVVDWKK